MEYWNIGMLDGCGSFEAQYSSIPVFQHSNTQTPGTPSHPCGEQFSQTRNDPHSPSRPSIPSPRRLAVFQGFYSKTAPTPMIRPVFRHKE